MPKQFATKVHSKLAGKADLPASFALEYRYSIPEAARALKISRAHLYRRIAAHEITAQHDGSRIFISRVALIAYVERADKEASVDPVAP